LAVVRSILAAVLGVGVIALVATLEGAAAVSVTACNTTDANTVYSPVTGVVVNAAMLIAPYRCGEAADEVYEYAPVLVDSTGHVVAALQYGCYANAFFVNLTSDQDSGAPLTFTVYVYAWNLQTYTQQSQAIQEALDLVGSDALPNAEVLQRFNAIPTTWTTTCQAVQTTNIEQLALCQPLVPSVSGPTPPADAGPDAEEDASADAPAMEPDGEAKDGSALTDGEARDAEGSKPDGAPASEGGSADASGDGAPGPDGGDAADGAELGDAGSPG